MKKIKKIICLLLSVLMVTAFASCSSQKKMSEKQAEPVNLSVPEQRAREQIDGDIYVSPSGSDQNPGTKEEPLKTLQKALETARTLDKQERSFILRTENIKSRPLFSHKRTAASHFLPKTARCSMAD